MLHPTPMFTMRGLTIRDLWPGILMLALSAALAAPDILRLAR